MTLKQTIAHGKEKLKTYRDFLDTIKVLMENKDDKKAIEFLLEIQRLDFEAKAEFSENKLALLEKQRMAEFELESSETNAKISKLILEVSKFIGKDPVGVTSKIGPLVDSYNTDNLTQEMRNDIYFELKGHYIALTEKIK